MGWLGEILQRLQSSPAVDYTSGYVGPLGPEILPGEHYVRVWLRAARVVDVRRWSQKFHATVHGRFATIDLAQGDREVVGVVAPDKSFEELDPRNLDRLIVVNQPLFGPVPYRGELSMEVGLFSVAATDLAKPYLELLSSMTSTASVAFLGQAKAFLDPLKRGAELLLFNGAAAELEIGLARTDTLLHAGEIVVARAQKGTLDLRQVRLDPQDYRLLDAQGKPLTAFPYMVLGVERLGARPDYPRIPEIRSGWEAVRQAAREGRDEEEVRRLFGALRRTVRLSPDLVSSDKTRIASLLARELGMEASAPTEAARGLEAAVVGSVSGEGASSAGRRLSDLEHLLGTPASERGLEAAALSPPTRRISVDELQRMMRDPSVPEDRLRPYFTSDRRASRPFKPGVIPNPELVEVAPPETALEGAVLMDWANGLTRLRRRNAFAQRRAQGSRRPMLVSVGDSWFQFPIFLDDVVDQLGARYDIWSVDAAGITLEEIVLRNPEYLAALDRLGQEAGALLLSGSGNDIVGEDASGEPVIARILRPFEPGRPAEWFIDNSAFAERLDLIESCYRAMLGRVQRDRPGLPVLCHGYDRAIPGAPDDPRDPIWARPDEWLGGPLRTRLRIEEPALQREIVGLMIDRLNAMLRRLCGGNAGGEFRNAWHVDCRGLVPDSLWADELHPTGEGFTRVAEAFEAILQHALRRPG